MEETIQKVFNKKWKPLQNNYKDIEDGIYPGVYLLAFTNQNLERKKAEPRDVYYVGMSNARKGLESRIKQFINGIEKNGSHSAGMRFFKEESNGIPFSKSNHTRKFYLVSLTFKCDVNKLTRTPNDLRIMGDICKLEYDLLAYIKEVTTNEPVLNKK